VCVCVCAIGYKTRAAVIEGEAAMNQEIGAA